MSPEFMLNQLRINELLKNLPVETERALGKARDIAHNNNTNIGVIELYEGVCQEMGHLLVQTSLERNHINVADLEKELTFAGELEAQHGDWKKGNPNPPSHLTKLSQSALTNAIKISAKRQPNINPPSPSLSDLLQGIAKLVLNR